MSQRRVAFIMLNIIGTRIFGMFMISRLCVSTITMKPRPISNHERPLKSTYLNNLTRYGAPILIQITSLGY